MEQMHLAPVFWLLTSLGCLCAGGASSSAAQLLYPGHFCATLGGFLEEEMGTL